MKHLGEEQLIDLLMGESENQADQDHLAGCDTCTERMAILHDGLKAAKSVKPTMPLAAMPVISFEKYERQRKMVRMTWLAAAAIILMAILGFRAEIGAQGLVVQFALFHQTPSVDETRLMALEDKFMQALETYTSLSQDQFDARFDAFLSANHQELGEFSRVMRNNINRQNMDYDAKLLKLEEAFIAQQRSGKAIGPLR